MPTTVTTPRYTHEVAAQRQTEMLRPASTDEELALLCPETLTTDLKKAAWLPADREA